MLREEHFLIDMPLYMIKIMTETIFLLLKLIQEFHVNLLLEILIYLKWQSLDLNMAIQLLIQIH